MAKKVVGYIKLQVPAGKANPSPPIGPALGQKGLNIMEFCKAFNAQTQSLEPGLPIPVVITAYADKSKHVSVTKSPREGPLYFNIAPFLRETRNWRSEISATVLVWEKGKGEKVETDIRSLIQAHPDDKNYQALLFPLAASFTQIGEYLKAEKTLKDLREATGMKGREGLMALNLSAENEKWLRRYDRVATYSQEALDLSRREGYKGTQGAALINLSEARWNLGQRDEAVRLAVEALSLSTEMRQGSIGLAGRSHQMLGFYSLKMERLPEAIEHCQKSVDSLRKARAWAPLAQSYFFLGQAQRKSGATRKR